MNLMCDGPVVRWCSGLMTFLLLFFFLVFWVFLGFFCGVVVFWFFGFLIFWFLIFLGFFSCGFVVLWFFGFWSFFWFSNLKSPVSLVTEFFDGVLVCEVGDLTMWLMNW